MKKSSQYSLVLVTTPDRKTARLLARFALEAQLIACANLVPSIESHYWWQGKIEKSKEVFMLMKTAQSKLPELEKLIISKHPYDTPEFLVLPVNGGNEKYLAWISASVGKL